MQIETLVFEAKNTLLPEPWANLTLDFEAILRALQDVRYIGELRQRWNEIKKLMNNPVISVT